MRESGERRDIRKEDVISALKEHPGDLSPLHRFLDQETQRTKSSLDNLRLSIQVAEIKRDAGRESAREAFEDAATQAWQERQDELYQYCRAEAEKLAHRAV